jgi:hypothetical protein
MFSTAVLGGKRGHAVIVSILSCDIALTRGNISLIAVLMTNEFAKQNQSPPSAGNPKQSEGFLQNKANLVDDWNNVNALYGKDYGNMPRF